MRIEYDDQILEIMDKVNKDLESHGMKFILRDEEAEGYVIYDLKWPGHGHDEPCYYCGEPCNSLAGNPGLWPLGFPHRDDPGVLKYQHVKCVTNRLVENNKDMPSKVRKNIESYRDRYKMYFITKEAFVIELQAELRTLGINAARFYRRFFLKPGTYNTLTGFKDDITEEFAKEAASAALKLLDDWEAANKLPTNQKQQKEFYEALVTKDYCQHDAPFEYRAGETWCPKCGLTNRQIDGRAPLPNDDD